MFAMESLYAPVPYFELIDVDFTVDDASDEPLEALDDEPEEALDDELARLLAA